MLEAVTVDFADTQFEEVTLAEVRASSDGHELKRSDGWTLWVETGPITPQAGMTARFYGRGIGFPVRGVVIDGHTFFYRTPEQEQARHEAWVAELHQKQAEEYEQTKGQLAERLSVYPDVFRRRIERFLANSATAWEHQAYEMSVCDAALLIIETYPDADGHKAWVENDYKPDIPESFEMGLSGNQWDMARRLAFWWHNERENIYRDHAAISLLIGCEEAGCLPVQDETLLRNFPEPPEHIRASFGGTETARRALETGAVVCALKLRGQTCDGVVMMLSGDRGEVLTFAKQHKGFFTLVTNPKGLTDAL